MSFSWRLNETAKRRSWKAKQQTTTKNFRKVRPLDKKETAVIAAEIKISYTGNSFAEFLEVVEKIRTACDFDHKLTINVEGDFIKS